MNSVQEGLIVDNMGYAKSIAWQTIKTLPRNIIIDQDDIEQLAYQGLIQAAQRFEPEQFDGRGDRDLNSYFKTYAYPRIRGTIIDECRKLTFVRRRGLEKGLSFQFLSLDNANNVSLPDINTAQRMDLELAIDRLSDREQRVIYGFMLGSTGKEIADELGVTESRVSQIKAEACGKMEQVLA